MPFYGCRDPEVTIRLSLGRIPDVPDSLKTDARLLASLRETWWAQLQKCWTANAMERPDIKSPTMEHIISLPTCLNNYGNSGIWREDINGVRGKNLDPDPDADADMDLDTDWESDSESEVEGPPWHGDTDAGAQSPQWCADNDSNSEIEIELQKSGVSRCSQYTNAISSDMQGAAPHSGCEVSK